MPPLGIFTPKTDFRNSRRPHFEAVRKDGLFPQSAALAPDSLCPRKWNSLLEFYLQEDARHKALDSMAHRFIEGGFALLHLQDSCLAVR